MRRRKNSSTLPEGWLRSEEFKWNGRHISRGTLLSIKGERGRFRFMYHTTTAEKEWIDVIGGTRGVEMWRSFRPEKIRTVHISK